MKHMEMLQYSWMKCSMKVRLPRQFGLETLISGKLRAYIVEKNWFNHYNHSNHQCVSVPNLCCVVEYSSCLLGTCAPVVNSVWSQETDETAESTVHCSTSYALSCAEFWEK